MWLAPEKVAKMDETNRAKIEAVADWLRGLKERYIDSGWTYDVDELERDVLDQLPQHLDALGTVLKEGGRR